MSQPEMGLGRTYEGGRPTIGWVKGERIRDIRQLSDGTQFILVNHNFQTENFAIVVEQRPLLPGVWAGWCSPYAGRIGTDVFSVHQFMLDESHSEEYYVAERYERDPTLDEPAVVVIEMIYDDFDPFGSQSIPYYDKALYDETREEAEEVVNLLRAEIKKMDTDMQALLTVYIRSNEIDTADALETLREIAGYEIRHEMVDDIRSNPVLAYWHQFTDESLAHYTEKGKDLA